ncbi:MULTISPECIES: general secretion pathway protein GspN [unclassified Pseudomonas]|uniref:general secretion pathway protein GspN n=1 Tax=unclassified Pseudomonas TaxID=196821 RepID=UPI0024479FB5|nr:MULTISPECIES: general secretion pathway protein GspN [unclassified Pseudomonas]MDH0304957.1 type II secretion system protein N [Pseudomonas sp. GD04091]MDH1987560.1 type II secretion system protein N [Pseudomonas sp. GD03689]
MSRRAGAWLGLVFILTLLAQWPAGWLGLPLQGVTGSLWQGQAARLGTVGPLRWDLNPWRLEAQLWLGFQGQGWQARLKGWPWRWQAEVEALGRRYSVPQGYRLGGQWQGVMRLQGAGRQCQAAQGRITVNDLALVEPWSLGLGQGAIEMRCQGGWRLSGNLRLPGQHQLVLDADLPGRRATVDIEVQPEAGLTPVLRGVQWLGAEALQGQRVVRW